MVLMVIDALRADFIIGESNEESMPFLTKLHQSGEACSYPAKAHAPTVTLPRIKALVTGSVPGFSDVIFNLGSSQIEGDSLIHQLETRDHKIGKYGKRCIIAMSCLLINDQSVFYGDDTWLKLFPDTFLRSEGTTSFFVNDYTEVF